MSTFIIPTYFCLFCILCFSTRIRSDYLYHNCPNTTTYSPNSTYRSNLNKLFSTIYSAASREIEYFNYMVGSLPPDSVYGVFLCRGDVNSDACQQCVENATIEVRQRCPKEKRATIWYDYCILRYSNESIFWRPEQSFAVYMWNTQNITDEPNRFRQLLGETMNELASEAASGKGFATKIVNFTESESLYALTQCMPDLSIDDCNLCLRNTISQLRACCDNKKGGRVIVDSCNIRYETYPFFNSTVAPVPPPTPNIPPIQPPPPSPSTSSPSPSTSSQGNGGISKQVIIAIVVPIAVSFVLFFIIRCFLSRRTRKKAYDAVNEENDEGNEISSVESLQYDLNTIALATNNFSADNKIGEGGFGSVYKGTFLNGQEIAVKRLSKNSGQGEKEFKNEVVVVAKLQHRNLVRLLGFCLERGEKILVYEFVPNKSLDYFLFNPEKGQMLDWSNRYMIIGGIARGLVYLHQDSRLRIIHRDLKASNILLDEEMNPKISDFGMARIFGVDQFEGNTNRIVGTYGYMSPEYAMHGQFSIKSDVFSFGVLVLEIISGKKNSTFYQSDGAEDLLSYSWKLWRDNRPLELMDLTLKNAYTRNEVIRCIQIGLLCVHEDADERPNMASILLALNGYSAPLAVPRQPAFFLSSRPQSLPEVQDLDNPTPNLAVFSTNEVSITELHPR